MKKLILIFIIFISIFGLQAQKAELLNPQNYYYSGKLALFSTFTTESESKDSLTLNFFYKIPINNLLYVQKNNGNYFAHFNIELSFSDSDGVIRFHKIFSDTIDTEKNLNSDYNFKFVSNFLKFNIPNKQYTLTARTTDLNSKSTEKAELSYIAKSAKSSKLMSCLFLVKRLDESQYETEILNNNLSFSAESIKLLVNIPNSQNFNQIRYKIYKYNKEDKELWKEKIELSGKLINSTAKPEFVKNEDKIILLNSSDSSSYTTTSSDYTATIDYFEINYKNNPFVPGNYLLQVFLGSKDTLEAKFQVIWDDKPLCLNNIPIALKISEIFFTKSEMKDMNDGGRIEQYQNLIKAWEKFNPNKELKYNEALMEFYRRADYAYFNFSTFSERNGAYSDKARIYILNGPPDEIKESFKNGKLFEKWTYQRNIKEYTFESIEAGVFKLVQIKE